MYGLTNPFKDGQPFSLDSRPRTIEDGDEETPIWVTAHLRDKEWEQYCDKDIYEADKRIRSWAAKCKEEIPNWTYIHKYRKFAMFQMFEILFGRPYDGQKDAKFGGKLRNLMNYYASSINKCTYDEKTKSYKNNRNCYVLAPKRLEGPPYSLKLRFEWLLANDKKPSGKNMKMPDTSLKAGHARSKKTELAKQRRSQRAKEAYLAYQKRYRDEHKSNSQKEDSEPR